MNDSLLQSESIFIPIDSSVNTLASQDLKTEDDCDIQGKYPPISLTQEQAMRLLHIAASIIQSNFKRYLQQKRYKIKLREQKAATKIQALWRGYRTRNLDVKVLQLKNEYMVRQFQNYFLSELETKSVFSSSLLRLSEKVEKLSSLNDKNLNKMITDQKMSDHKSKENIMRNENGSELSVIQQNQNESREDCKLEQKSLPPIVSGYNTVVIDSNSISQHSSFDEQKLLSDPSPVDIDNVIVILDDDDDDDDGSGDI